MRKPLRLAIMALLLIFLCALACLLLYLQPESIYQNRPSSFGTNTVPVLLRYLEAHDSTLKLKLVALAQKQHIVNISFVPAETLHRSAINGFVTLATDTNAPNQLAPFVPALLKIFENNRHEDVRANAALALGLIGPPAKDAVPALLRYVTNTSGPMRWEAIQALGSIHAQPETVLPVLIKILASPTNHDAAARALSGFGTNAAPAVPALIANLQDPDRIARAETAMALGRIHSSPELVLPALLNSLNDPDPLMRRYAAYGLGDMGAQARPAVTALLGMLQNTNFGVGGAAASALAKIHAEPQLVVPALMESLKHPTSGTILALEAIGSFGKDAKPAVPQLLELLADKQFVNFRPYISKTIKQIDPEAAAQAGLK